MKPYNPAKWNAIRAKGKTRFILIRGVLLWGLPMLVFMSFITKPFTNGFLSPAALVHYVAWIFAGVVFGVFLWFVLERKHKKETSERTPT